MSDKLSIEGGTPIRQEPYPIHSTMIDANEEREVLEVLRSGHLSGFSARPGVRFLGGPKVQRLEEEFCRFFKVAHAVTFNSATSALHGAVSASKVGPGDEVVVPPFTMSATATSVVMQNGVPVFADIEQDTFGLDPASVSAVISPRTKAILAVNLFGHPCHLEELDVIARKNGIVLLEDNSQSPDAVCGGSLAGTIGKIGIQSLNYHKFIQTGEGGVALTDDEDAAKHLQLVRNHGEVVIGHLDQQEVDAENVVGWNYRLTEIQAAIGVVQLKKLKKLNALRVNLANALTEQLRNFDFLIPPTVRDGFSHVYYLFPIRFLKDRIGISRETFVKAIRAEGISIAEGYVRPIYLEPMFQKKVAYGSRGCPFRCPWYEGKLSYEKGRCPTAERMYFKELLTTDICKYPNSEREIEEFVRAVGKIRDNVDVLKKMESN